MKHRKLAKAAAVGLSVTMMTTGGSLNVLANNVANEPQEVQQGSVLLQNNRLPAPLLITEMVPNTDNMGDSDAYEYFEITNVSGREINLEDYDIVYFNGSTKTIWDTDVTRLPAGETILVWVKNGGNQTLTKEDFYKFYGIPTDTLVAETQCGGMSNSGTRSMTIATKTGKDLCTVTYSAADSDGGKLDVAEAIVFSYEGDQITVSYNNEPTPLAVSSVVGEFTAPAQVDAPSVTAASNAVLNQNESLMVSIGSTNLDKDNIVSASIAVVGGGTYSMTYNESGKLTGEIPFGDVKDLPSFQYTVTVFDGTNTAVSQPKTVTISQEGAQVDATKAPALVVTELAPDTSNTNGADAYEFIELYNNSNRDIDLKDYRLYYYYPSNGNNTLWWNTAESKILKSGETLVFWVKNNGNTALTIDDFNAEYDTSFTQDQLIEISCGGMANSGARGMRICSNVGDQLDIILYNETDVDDTDPNSSISFQNQYVDGAFTSVLVNNRATPTPGVVTDEEMPYYQAQLVEPECPVITDNTPASFNNATESLSFSVDATSEGGTIKTVTLYTMYEGQSEYEVSNLERSGENTFTKTLSNIDLLNKKSFTYYFAVSDGFNTVSTDSKTIQNEDAAQINADFNLQEGSVIGGSTQVIAYGDTLVLDGQDVSGEAEQSINGNAKFVFDASQTDAFFKNAATVNGDVIGVFNEGTYESWRTYIFDVNASHFDVDSKTITVELHAGNKANVLEHNIENNDDFVVKNLRMVLPSGKTLYPTSYEAKNGLGAVEHPNMDDVEKKPLTVDSQETEIKMGDGTSKCEIVYANFTLSAEDFDAVRYLWDTTQVQDGAHSVSNGSEQISVTVDNTAPVITTNMEEGKEYHQGTITVSAQDAISSQVNTVVLLDGKTISTPYDFRSVEMTAGNHTLSITARDELGNTSTKEVTFATPEESADIDSVILPENGATVGADPTLSITATDPSGDLMDVTFKQGERYQLGDSSVSVNQGVSDTAGAEKDSFQADSGDGFPYECFSIDVSDNVNENAFVDVTWTGTSNNLKTYLYVYNTATAGWDKIEAAQTVEGDTMTLKGAVSLKDHLVDGAVKVMVQNGEGYTPAQYAPGAQGQAVTTSNVDDTPREDYDFTFAIESDTQYYNEDYDGNPDQGNDGQYQYQLDIHDWVIANRERMNIQYLFHDGDIIDDEPNIKEWEQADAAYQMLDNAGVPYGILAGNHDVGGLREDYGNYSTYFGESRYNHNAWYGGSYQDNRGHYDLITVDGIDFIMLYMGWGIGDEEIQWMNDVLAQYPERKAILNFHEYLLASGGLGEEPQRIYDEVVSKNENVCLVLSGHYHNAYSRVDTFTNADGSERKVYSLLFDYQGLPEGGMGYMRLMHFDLDGQKVIFRTYSPSLDDYDAKASAVENEGNDYVVPDANINGEETFEISFADLGIVPQTKTLSTSSLDVNVYGDQIIGSVEDVKSGESASVVWKNAPQGLQGWYAEVTDQYGGLSRTPVQYLTVETDTDAPVLTLPDQNTILVGETFDAMEGVTATDLQDGDLTQAIRVTGTVNTGVAGTYELTYTVTDRAGNTTTETRVITVKVPDTSDPGTTDPGQGGDSGNQGGDGGDQGNSRPDGSQDNDGGNQSTGQPGDNQGNENNSQSDASSGDKDADSVPTGETSRLGFFWVSAILSAVLGVFGLLKRKKETEE